MVGQIQAAGDTYAGYMPAFKQLPDDQIASILTWLSSLGASKPAPVIAVADIAAARARTQKPAEVLAERTALDAQHPLP